jgi:hypothetical protein
MVGRNTYDDMREQMMATEQRAQLQEDLGHIKSTIEELEAAHTPENFDKLEAELAALLEKYKGTPLEAKVNALFGERLEELKANRNARDAAHAAAAEVSTIDPADADASQAAGRRAKQAGDAYNHAWQTLANQLESWRTDIEAKMDKLGTEDQLALIRIQELNSRITQATQTASNLMASHDQAQSAAIMNLKG